jgi:malonate-semialdehyde dehydrogenase (acetylating)/methylmalonate-semialdehyde dehydrogenase
VPVAWHSFGDWQRSLFADHHAYGQDAVRFYTPHQSVRQGWPDSIAKPAEFALPVAK